MNAAVFVLSAAVVAGEIVLMRLFSIAQWHHFAAMILSIALLGFGLSGTLLALWRQRLRGTFAVWLVGFAVSLPLCLWLALQIPFSPFLIIWQRAQLGYLLGIYLLLVVPFTCAALAIAIALDHARDRGRVGVTYAANLLGSGVGAVAGWALCFLPWPVPLSEYKGLQKALVMAGSRVVRTEYHPLGRVDVVENPALRVAGGLSLAYAGTVPAFPVLFVDGDGGSAIVREPAEYLEWLPSAAPYQVRPVGSVLVIGVGGGAELQQARRFGAREVWGVELHPRVAALSPGVWVAEGRAFLRQSRERFDLIQISLLDSLAASAAGLSAVNESYLYTVEAFEDFFGRLTESGVLCVTRWLKSPPRDNIKVFATAVEALERVGVAEPAAHLMFVRGWASGTVLMKRTPFTEEEIRRVREWAQRCLFDVDYFPGAGEADVNRCNVMEEPLYYRAARELLFGQRERFYRGYLFNVRPATDERPYFFHFFRWSTAPHLLRTMGRQWVPFVEWGYVVLVATLGQAALASVVLVVLPWRRAAGGLRWPVFVYFGCLGLGFMLLEVVLLQRFVLFLGNPLYSATVVIATFLVFAGLGSTQTGRRIRDAGLPALVVVLVTVGYVVALPVVFGFFLASAEWVRALVAVGLLAPLGFFMGMMFPVGLARVASSLLPWAWGVNGCFSVIGAVLASVLAMDFGFDAVMVVAAVLYGCAGAVFGRLSE